MTWTLAIDTSSTVAAALAHDGALVAEEHLDDTRAHTEQLMPMVQRLCSAAGIALRDVDDVVVGVGPGPFTGLRVGIVTAHTVATLAGVQARGVCSLDIIARDAVARREGAHWDAPDSDFLTIIDARRKELYWARHDATGARVDGPHVTPPDALPDLPAAGPGALLYGRQSFGPTTVSAGVAAVHRHDLPVLGLEALYLRQPDAAEPTARKSALPTTLKPRRRRERR